MFSENILVRFHKLYFDITGILHFTLDKGILFANGKPWKEMRRFALSNLRDFGMGKKAGENKIVEETQYLIQVFEKHQGKCFSCIVLCLMLYGILYCLLFFDF